MNKKSRTKMTYNTRDSPVVTDPSTSLAVTGLSMGERTGSRVFQYLWSYVSFISGKKGYKRQYSLQYFRPSVVVDFCVAWF